MHNFYDLITLFNRCFQSCYHTVLIAGEEEPIYLPMSAKQTYHQVVFANGFYSSALHEIAHWCIAGERRRQQIDYGYWYVPDGRNARQQQLFQQVEIKPQAIEMLFSQAVDYPFQFSIDNLTGENTECETFKKSVLEQANEYRQLGLPARAEQFLQALQQFQAQPLIVLEDTTI